jgi:transposase
MTIVADTLLPYALWQLIQPVLPLPTPELAMACGAPVPDRAWVAGILFMPRTSTPWALLPVAEFGCGSVTTCWRRFAAWAHAGMSERLQELLLKNPAGRRADGLRVSVDSFSLRAVRGDTLA